MSPWINPKTSGADEFANGIRVASEGTLMGRRNHCADRRVARARELLEEIKTELVQELLRGGNPDAVRERTAAEGAVS